MISLLLTFLAGLFIFFGGITVFIFNKKDKLHALSIGLSIGVLFLLILTDLIPESYELLSGSMGSTKAIITLIIMTLIGILFVKFLDNFVPEHDEYKSSHVALVTSIALFIHNVSEGMALYATCELDFKIGFLLVVGVALHNYALGLSIASEYYAHTNNKKNILIILLFLTLSTLIGGIIMLLFNPYIQDNLILGIIISSALGMIIYILIFELIPHFIKIKDKKASFLGLIIGIILMLVTMFLE